MLVLEDGPSLTHGGLPWGAGYVAAKTVTDDILDPRPYAGPLLRAAYARYPHIGPVLPALGYTHEQLAALRQVINAAPVDAVVSATPIDLARLIEVHKPLIRACYELREVEVGGKGWATLAGALEKFLATQPVVT